MADSHPFANAGLGMFGTAEKSFAARGMTPPSKGETSITDLLAMFFAPKSPNPYAMQGNIGVAPGASGQGVAPPAMPGGLGMNPYRRSGIGLSSPTGMQSATPQMQTPTASTSGAGLDINNMIDSFWGAQ